MSTIETPYPLPAVLRRSLQAGFTFFLVKGCAWLLMAAWLGELL